MRYDDRVSRTVGSTDLESVRATMQSSTDPRAERTRRAIVEAVGQLTSLGQAPISVSDVVRQAGISRSSFYVHFSNLDELAVSALQLEFHAIGTAGMDLRREGLLSGRETARIGYRRLVSHLLAHDSLYSSVLGLPLSWQAYEAAVSAYAEELLPTIVTLPSVPPDIIPAVAARYLAAGSLMIISSWVRGDSPISDDELVDQLVSLLPSWFGD